MVFQSFEQLFPVVYGPGEYYVCSQSDRHGYLLRRAAGGGPDYLEMVGLTALPIFIPTSYQEE